MVFDLPLAPHGGTKNATRARRPLRIDKEKKRLEELVLLKVDDSLEVGTISFPAREETASKKFRSKPRVPVTTDPTSFNSLTKTRARYGTFSTTQE